MPDPIQRRNPHRAVGETNQDAINRLAGERAAALADADRLRSEVATLRAAGDELAREIEERDTPYGPLAREVQAWRSAAGGAS